MSNEVIEDIELDSKPHDRHIDVVAETASIGRQIFGYPISVMFIFANEFCERFSFYGMKAVLYMYLSTYLGFGNNEATSLYHTFVFFSYMTPLFGGIIADTKLGTSHLTALTHCKLTGKYRTILYLSLIYCLGQLVLTISAVPGVMGTPPHAWGSFIGLFLIAIGTGGIKPCVSSFGGDQIPPDRMDLLTSFFSVFYVCINSGSFVSTTLTPIFRVKVGFWLAFLVPTILLAAAIIVFWSGRKMYKKNPPGENMVLIFARVIKMGIKEKIWGRKSRYANWLDPAEKKYGRRIVKDVQSVLNIMLVFVPLPCYWALFDQTSSRWIEQARDMNGHILGLTVQPDQIPTLNPLLIMLFVPCFDRIIYPWCRKRGYNILPLRRMVYGMVLTAITFGMAGFLQIAVDGSEGVKSVSMAWQLLQYVVLTAGEVLVSISSLEFAYSQAPNTMKSVVMSIQLLTVSLGNIFVAFVAEFSPLSLRNEFFFYSILMVFFTIVFMLLTRKYAYIEPGGGNFKFKPTTSGAKELTGRRERGQMADFKSVAAQLKKLASDPANRAYIVQDKTCFVGVVNFLDERDPETVQNSLECLYNLTLLPENRPLMIQNTPNLPEKLKKMMLDYSLEHRSKQLAGNTYANLQNHLDAANQPPKAVVPPPNVATPLRDSTNLTNNSGIRTPRKSTTTGPPLSFFSDKVATTGAQTHTLTVYVKGLNSTIKPQIDQQLVSLTGVISFIVDIQRKRITIRTIRSEAEIKACLREINLKSVVVPAHMEDQENSDNGYLPEPEAGSGSWFSSLVSWGSSTVEERREAQRRTEQKKNYMSSRHIAMSDTQTERNGKTTEEAYEALISEQKRTIEELQQKLVQIQKERERSNILAEIEEEHHINHMIKYTNQLKKEKEDLAIQIEREEEYLTNTLGQKLLQLRKEKIDLENQLEQESEKISNRLQKQISELNEEKKSLEQQQEKERLEHKEEVARLMAQLEELRAK
ncbi:hypothetical protein PROFUN_02332 [Planoprotostelium fungivorum]|uniref:Uncharacterized protein n=1 Tax=Planoprotostelium fungivorum TaxID=1890364 RepID=A0A2P6NYM1_9EUKA|nr:hypothetical protein PROFUN_02332 [Planoprotostelium fungivorum]